MQATNSRQALNNIDNQVQDAATNSKQQKYPLPNSKSCSCNKYTCKFMYSFGYVHGLEGKLFILEFYVKMCVLSNIKIQ